MLTHIRLENYRSFVKAEVDLAPFTLVLGANGAGKTNFLRAFQSSGRNIAALLSKAVSNYSGITYRLPPHYNHPSKSSITLFAGTENVTCEETDDGKGEDQGHFVRVYALSPAHISQPEIVVSKAFVKANGAGTTQVLESLKNGDREDLFDAAETALISYVPEIEKLSFSTGEKGNKQLQVRERGINRPVPAHLLSEGTRLIIALLAIIHQPIKPPVILLEDIDRGMHPRVFEQMVKLMRRIAHEQDVQIIATTHNPYLVDCFQDEPEAVVIVEKKDGASTLSTLAQKLKGLDYDKVDPNDMPLGNLWFSGFVGGVPEFLRPARK